MSLPNYFDLTCSYLGVVPRIHLTYDSVDDFGASAIIEEDEDISDEGYRVLMGAASAGEIDYTINDACDRFFDEIDLLTADINEIDKQIEDLMTAFVAGSELIADSEFDKKVRSLRWGRMVKEEIKTALEGDLGRLLGRYDVPF